MTPEKPTAHDLTVAVVHLQASVMALACGILGGLSLFFMTAWLLLKGGPEVGSHLSLLGQYFPGYAVTWPGSILGLVYGSLFGALVGWAIGTIYNWVATLRHGRR